MMWLKTYFVILLSSLSLCAFAGSPITSKEDDHEGIATVLYSYPNKDKSSTPVDCRYETVKLNNPPPQYRHSKTQNGYVTSQSPWDSTAGHQQLVQVRRCFDENNREVSAQRYKYQTGEYVTRFKYRGTQYAMPTANYVEPGTRFQPSAEDLLETY